MLLRYNRKKTLTLFAMKSNSNIMNNKINPLDLAKIIPFHNKNDTKVPVKQEAPRPMLYRDFVNLKSLLSISLVDQHFLAGTMTNLWAPGNFDKIKSSASKIKQLMASDPSVDECIRIFEDVNNYFDFILSKKSTWLDWLKSNIKEFQERFQEFNQHKADKSSQDALILMGDLSVFLDKFQKGCIENLSEIRDPTFSIITRVIQKHPNYLFLPHDPAYPEIYSIIDRAWNYGGWLDEAFDELNPVYQDLELSPKRIGILFGCSATTGYSWENENNISKIIIHLMMIVKSVIEKNGAAGFKKYIEIVHEEALSRGIDTQKELWSTGWKNKSRNDNNDGVNYPSRMRIRDMINLRDRLGLTLIDIQWLIGSLGHMSSVKDGGIIEDPTFALIIRYLIKYPEDLIIPKAPSASKFIEIVTPIWNQTKWKYLDFNLSRIGIMLGCTKIAGYSWTRQTTMPSQSVQHLMLIILKAIELDGKDGLENYLTILEEEARARQVGTERLWIKEGWSTFKRQGYVAK